jgi:hypothetical protein
MFQPLHPEFNLKRLVAFIAALWLQVTVLVILCCASSLQMPQPSDKVDTLHPMACNGAPTMAARAVATLISASLV